MVGMLQYLLHGIPEILAYFIGALASGMISFALVKHDFMGPKFKNIMKDTIGLISISVVILFLLSAIGEKVHKPVFGVITLCKIMSRLI
jgi:hypothetical protein